MATAELIRIDRTLIEIKAPPERVWRALTNAKELSTWFQVTIEGDIAPGNEVWMTSMSKGYAGVRFRVRFMEMIGHKDLFDRGLCLLDSSRSENPPSSHSRTKVR